MKELNKQNLILEVENSELKLKEREQKRMMTQMMQTTTTITTETEQPEQPEQEEQEKQNEEKKNNVLFSSSSQMISQKGALLQLNYLKKEMLKREHESEMENMRLQAHLLRVRGRVHVKVRIRPTNSEEKESNYDIISEADDDGKTLAVSKIQKFGRERASRIWM